MTVSRIWNLWVQDRNTESRTGSQRPPITSSREDRHVTRHDLNGTCSHVMIPESIIGVVYMPTKSSTYSSFDEVPSAHEMAFRARPAALSRPLHMPHLLPQLHRLFSAEHSAHR
ncbi:hypothetical protein TNCV_4069921 [Trichonephila clavipes]|nr:hypothetical protein TNCV_4069921 [Trichonephila clavipes]